MEGITSEAQLQVRFITKQESYAVPDVPFSVPATIDSNKLNNLINTLLKENNPDFLKPLDFDFLVANELLRVTLLEQLQNKSISLECVIDVEYVQRTPPPQPEDALLHDDWISGVQTAEKYVLTGCYDNTVNIWTVKGKHIFAGSEHSKVIKAISWLKKNDPSQGFVTVSHDLRAILWHWEPGSDNAEPLVALRGHERGIDSVGVSLDGSRIATGGWDTNLKLWSGSLTDLEENNAPPTKKTKGVVTRTPLHTLKGHKESISSCIWTELQTVCTASMDHTIKLWDTELCGIRHEIVGQKAFLSASWSPLSNSLLASSADRHIRLYDPRSTEGTICKSTFTSHTAWVPSVSWSQSSENLFMSGGYDECVKLWDTRSPNAPLFDLKGHQGKVFCVDWTNPNYLVSGGSDNSVHVFKNKQA